MRMKILVDGEQRGQLGVDERLGCLLREEWSGGEQQRDREQANLHPARIPERRQKTMRRMRSTHGTAVIPRRADAEGPPNRENGLLSSRRGPRWFASDLRESGSDVSARQPS